MPDAIKYIALDKLTSTLESLSGKLRVWVPAAFGDGKGGVCFKSFSPDMVPDLGHQSTLGPKGVLLPQVEPLFRFGCPKDSDEPSKRRMQLEDPTAPELSLVFGTRPCDARGFLVFDRTFSTGPYVDVSYTARREKTLLATLVCLSGDSACFCSSVRSGPADMTGSDLRITPIAGGYVVEALNERAMSALELMGEAAGELQVAEARKVQKETAERKVGNLIAERSAANFLDRFGDMDYWRDTVSQCLSCGICTFVCPTCYCFSITDEMKGMRGERIRSWDSCMFYTYTLEASGHNPRPTKLERYRNRVGHKFSYFPEKYEGLIACCGCGRCIRQCPVSIDIRRVVQGLEATECVPAGTAR